MQRIALSNGDFGCRNTRKKQSYNYCAAMHTRISAQLIHRAIVLFVKAQLKATSSSPLCGYGERKELLFIGIVISDISTIYREPLPRTREAVIRCDVALLGKLRCKDNNRRMCSALARLRYMTAMIHPQRIKHEQANREKDITETHKMYLYRQTDSKPCTSRLLPQNPVYHSSWDCSLA